MSLINDMLRDLDDPHRLARVGSGSPVVEPNSRSLRASVLSAVAVICVVCWLIFEWGAPGLAQANDLPSRPVMKTVVQDRKWLEQLEQAQAIVDERDREKALSVASAAPIQREIDLSSNRPALPSVELEQARQAEQSTLETAQQRLLENARDALMADRLTVPINSNAHHYFSTVLLMDPQNGAAMKGLQSVRNRYLDLINQAISRKDLRLARKYLGGARIAGMDSRIIAQKVSQVERLSLSAEIDSRVEEEPMRASVAKSSPSHTDQLLARSLDRQGLRTEEEALQWIASGADVDLTTLALIEQYSGLGAAEKLQALSRRLDSRSLVTGTLAAAHRDRLNQDPQAAIRRLESVELTGATERARLRLLGGLLQETKAFAGAVEAYQALVDMPEANSYDWLGLAVALDAQEQHDAALRIYRYLVDQDLPGSDVAAYVSWRLDKLTETRPR